MDQTVRMCLAEGEKARHIDVITAFVQIPGSCNESKCRCLCLKNAVLNNYNEKWWARRQGRDMSTKREIMCVAFYFQNSCSRCQKDKSIWSPFLLLHFAQIWSMPRWWVCRHIPHGTFSSASIKEETLLRRRLWLGAVLHRVILRFLSIRLWCQEKAPRAFFSGFWKGRAPGA